MFKIFIDGNDDRLRLEDFGGKKFGWIDANTFGFGGLPSENIAINAAVEGWHSLEKALQRAYPGRTARSVDASKVRLVHDGAYEWVADGIRPLARLLRPFTARNPEPSFALEFLVPYHATQHVTIASAQAVLETISSYIPGRGSELPRLAHTPRQSTGDARALTGAA